MYLKLLLTSTVICFSLDTKATNTHLPSSKTAPQTNIGVSTQEQAVTTSSDLTKQQETKLKELVNKADQETASIKFKLKKRQKKKRLVAKAGVITNKSTEVLQNANDYIKTTLDYVAEINPDPHSKIALGVVSSVLSITSKLITPAGFIVGRLFLAYGHYLNKSPLLSGDEILIDKIIAVNDQIDSKTHEIQKLVNPKEIPTGDAPMWKRLWNTVSSIPRITSAVSQDLLDKSYLTNFKDDRWDKIVKLRDELEKLQKEKDKFDRALKINIYAKALIQLHKKLNAESALIPLRANQKTIEIAMSDLAKKAVTTKGSALEKIQDEMKKLGIQLQVLSLEINDLEKPLTEEQKNQIKDDMDILEDEMERLNNLNNKDVEARLEDLQSRLEELENTTTASDKDSQFDDTQSEKPVTSTTQKKKKM